MIINESQILEQSDIREVLSYYNINLNSRGKCACPIHNGKKDNFSVSGNMGTCFSTCGKTWFPVSFVQEYKGLSYPEALEEVAKICRIDVQYKKDIDRTKFIQQSKQERSVKERMAAQNLIVIKQYRDNFNQSIKEIFPTIQEIVVAGRRFTKEVLDNFQITHTGALNTFIANKLYKDKSPLVEIGIIKEGKNGDYEAFRNKILFPLFNHSGILVGFASRRNKQVYRYKIWDDKKDNFLQKIRVIEDTEKEKIKYINSPESILFKKKELLYGLYQNQKSIRNKGFCYIVEGYMDVLSLYQYDIKNTVASSGNAFTEEQAKLLKRYTNYCVVLFDGDEAGIKAANRTIEVLLKVGIFVTLCRLPEKEDPDSFIRRVGKDQFKQYTDTNGINGLVSLAMANWDESDPHKRTTSIKEAGRLLSLVKDNTEREQYIIELTDKKKMGSVRKLLLDEIVSNEKKKLKKSKLDSRQEIDIRSYGVFVKHNKYFVPFGTKGDSVAITNFIIKPIMLIKGSLRSQRLVEIVNEHNESFVLNIESDYFVELSSFKKIIENQGNFYYDAKPEHYIKIKKKIYAEMTLAYPINTLGYHKEGFFSWSNGISINGTFQPIDEYGLVHYKNDKYFLPAFSKINKNVKSDDQQNSYEEEKLFQYIEGDQDIHFRGWAKIFHRVHGDNGKIALAFYFASQFRDIIYQMFDFFPHLFLFGPSGSGKSYLAWSIMAMYGKPKQPFHLVHGTNVAFFRRLSQIRNGVAWFDEYSNDVHFRRVEALKAAYDGAGHEKGTMSNDNRTVVTHVNSACLISGQQQPTQDIALFKRCVSLNFRSGKNSLEDQQIGEKLKLIEKTGMFSQITNNLQKYRSFVQNNFGPLYDQIKSNFSSKLSEYNIEDRILKNHLILLTFVQLFQEELEFPFSYQEIENVIFQNIITQSESISKQDELSMFWEIIDYLIESGVLKHETDIIVETLSTVTIKIDGAKRSEKQTQVKHFTNPTTVIFIRFTKAHPEYLEHHRRKYNKQGLMKAALQYYLKISDAFIGNVKSKKFKGQAKACMVFKMEDMPIDLPLTKEITQDCDEPRF